MITVKLNRGTIVLGKLHKGEPCALKYANRAQAKKKADEVGGVVYHWRGPFYVAPPTAGKEQGS